MTLNEARKVVETISDRISEESRIIWGAQLSDDLAGTLRVLLIVTGVQSSQIFGMLPKKHKKTGKNMKDIEKELGIEFVD
jgi:cell division protein FtsZ